jgi:hypothetical protein
MRVGTRPNFYLHKGVGELVSQVKDDLTWVNKEACTHLKKFFERNTDFPNFFLHAPMSYKPFKGRSFWTYTPTSIKG